MIIKCFTDIKKEEIKNFIEIRINKENIK